MSPRGYGQVRRGPHPKPLIERLRRYYDVGELHACWPWTGPAHRQGYGRIWIGSNYDGTRHHALAHRVGWEVFVGQIPEGMMVLHRCDHPPCMNPAHWYLGTQVDNMGDRQRRGRYMQSRREDGRFQSRAAG